MASLRGVSAFAEHAVLSKDHVLGDIEDEEDLFEINLDAVESIPPQPHYNWNSHYTTARDVLLANCLLPVTDISRAIPMVPKALAYKGGANDVSISEPAVPLGQLLRLPFSEAFGLYQRAVKPDWDLNGETESRLDDSSNGNRRFSDFSTVSLDVRSDLFKGRRRFSDFGTVSEDIEIYWG